MGAMYWPGVGARARAEETDVVATSSVFLMRSCCRRRSLLRSLHLAHWHGVRAAAATDLVDELGYGRGCTGGIDRREGQSDGSKDQREGHRERRNKRS